MIEGGAWRRQALAAALPSPSQYACAFKFIISLGNADIVVGA